MAAPRCFKSFVSFYGVSFVPLAGDPEIISQRLMTRVRMWWVRFAPSVITSSQSPPGCISSPFCLRRYRIDRALISLYYRESLTGTKLGTPERSVKFFPVFAPTRVIPPVAMPNLLPGSLSYLFHRLTIQVFWHGGNLEFNDCTCPTLGHVTWICTGFLLRTKTESPLCSFLLVA